MQTITFHVKDCLKILSSKSRALRCLLSFFYFHIIHHLEWTQNFSTERLLSVSGGKSTETDQHEPKKTRKDDG
jgi:hypothetical protein